MQVIYISPRTTKILVHIFETKIFKIAGVVLALLVAILVALNVFTPLRLSFDSMRYLNIMELLQGKLGEGSFAAIDFFPHGYSYLLLSLENVNLLSSAAIVVINILSVMMTGLLFCRLFPVKNRVIFVIFLFLSFINIKHFTLLLSDQLFTWMLLLSCCYWVKFFENGRKHLLPSILFSVITIYLRTAGIVLPIGLLLYAVYINRDKLFGSKLLKGSILVGAIAVIALTLVKLPALEDKVYYLKQLEINKMLHNPVSVLERINVHLQEMGECMVNIPASQIGRMLHIEGPFVRWIYIFIGVWVLVRIISNAIRLDIQKYFATWVILVYFLMVLVWPFYDTRFLIPMIPFILYLVFPFFYSAKYPRFVMAAVAGVYILFGIVSLLYSTALSLDHDKFLQYYGNSPQMTESYRQYFTKRPLPGPIPQQTDADPDRVLYLLYMYDK